MAENEFTFDYFRDEFKRFWDLCGDSQMSADRLQLAFNGLAFVAANTTEERERVTHLFTVAGNNFARRLPYFMMMDVAREKRLANVY